MPMVTENLTGRTNLSGSVSSFLLHRVLPRPHKHQTRPLLSGGQWSSRLLAAICLSNSPTPIPRRAANSSQILSYRACAHRSSLPSTLKQSSVSTKTSRRNAFCSIVPTCAKRQRQWLILRQNPNSPFSLDLSRQGTPL